LGLALDVIPCVDGHAAPLARPIAQAILRTRYGVSFLPPHASSSPTSPPVGPAS
jgi:hypothetical protein